MYDHPSLYSDFNTPNEISEVRSSYSNGKYRYIYDVSRNNEDVILRFNDNRKVPEIPPFENDKERIPMKSLVANIQSMYKLASDDIDIVYHNMCQSVLDNHSPTAFTYNLKDNNTGNVVKIRYNYSENPNPIPIFKNILVNYLNIMKNVNPYKLYTGIFEQLYNRHSHNDYVYRMNPDNSKENHHTHGRSSHKVMVIPAIDFLKYIHQYSMLVDPNASIFYQMVDNDTFVLVNTKETVNINKKVVKAIKFDVYNGEYKVLLYKNTTDYRFLTDNRVLIGRNHSIETVKSDNYKAFDYEKPYHETHLDDGINNTEDLPDQTEFSGIRLVDYGPIGKLSLDHVKYLYKMNDYKSKGKNGKKKYVKKNRYNHDYTPKDKKTTSEYSRSTSPSELTRLVSTVSRSNSPSQTPVKVQRSKSPVRSDSPTARRLFSNQVSRSNSPVCNPHMSRTDPKVYETVKEQHPAPQLSDSSSDSSLFNFKQSVLQPPSRPESPQPQKVSKRGKKSRTQQLSKIRSNKRQYLAEHLDM